MRYFGSVRRGGRHEAGDMQSQYGQWQKEPPASLVQQGLPGVDSFVIPARQIQI